MIDDEGEEKEDQDGGEKKAEVKKDTSHAPDLLEGPSINQMSELLRGLRDTTLPEGGIQHFIRHIPVHVESHLRQLFFSLKNNCLGRVVLCCFVFLLCCVALPFFLSILWMIKSCSYKCRGILHTTISYHPPQYQI